VRPPGQLQRLGDEDALVQPLQLLKRYGTAAEVQDFATKHAMRYLLIAADEEPARRSFGRLNLMMGLPVTLVVDRSGIIRRRVIGPQTREAFEAAVRGVS